MNSIGEFSSSIITSFGVILVVVVIIVVGIVGVFIILTALLSLNNLKSEELKMSFD